jgi:hypothetical protein
MGSSFSTQVQWSTTVPSNQNDVVANLQTTVATQEMLYDIITMIEQICTSYPIESRTEFKMPIVWTCHITPDIFASHASSTLWVIKEAQKSHKATVSSLQQRNEGQPMFFMEQLPGETTLYKAKVSSFDYLQKFLQVANKEKLTELKSMLQSKFIFN